jgi:hypothetical protein
MIREHLISIGDDLGMEVEQLFQEMEKNSGCSSTPGLERPPMLLNPRRETDYRAEGRDVHLLLPTPEIEITKNENPL